MAQGFLMGQWIGEIRYYAVSTINSGQVSNPAVTISGLAFQPKGVVVLRGNYTSVSSGYVDANNFGRLSAVHLKDLGEIYKYVPSILMDVSYGLNAVTIKWTYPNPGKAYMYDVQADYVVIG